MNYIISKFYVMKWYPMRSICTYLDVPSKNDVTYAMYLISFSIKISFSFNNVHFSLFNKVVFKLIMNTQMNSTN